MSALQSIRYERGSLLLLEQRSLPHAMNYVRIEGIDACYKAIKDMTVRGAPAIAIAGGLALAVELSTRSEVFKSGADAAEYVKQRLAYLVTSRPTAVNLAEICTRLTDAAAAAAAAGADGEGVVLRVIAAAEEEQAKDVRTNRAIGQHGAAALLQGRNGPISVLTHCNTGSLATAGFGTALGVVRALAEAGKLKEVFCTETRPYNQGARLTAFELVHDGISPATLVADSAAAALMAAGRVDAVVVGADRVAANGDTANKIGTYSLAVAARHHGVPFFVAAPVTTLDTHTPGGAAIVIEQRDPEELTHFRGERVAADGIAVWNPSFDVTPAGLIRGIITESGVLARDGATGAFPVAAACAAAAAAAGGGPAAAAEQAEGCRPLDSGDVLRYISERPDLAARLGGAEGAWRVRDVSDGNINFVFVVEGPLGGLVLKQALPFIRITMKLPAGQPAWPLPVERIRVEAMALRRQRACCEQHVPEVYSWDEERHVLTMRYIEPPHTILRGALVGGASFPLLAPQMGEFMAATLFGTSALAHGGGAFRAAAAAFVNAPMCALTEQVVFSDPYYASLANSHTSPQLDADAAALRADAPARAAAARLKALFLERQQALLHGDLHTGSVMAAPSSLFVFDSEFAFYGPIAFDVGSFLANLMLALFASPGLEAAAGGDRSAQRAWLAVCVCDTWREFERRFLARWSAAVAAGTAGEAALPALYGEAAEGGAAALAAVQGAFMREVFVDALGFAGCKMVRRIVGIAHVEDFKAIADADARAACERRALRFGRRLIVEAASFRDVAELAAAAGEAARGA